MFFGGSSSDGKSKSQGRFEESLETGQMCGTLVVVLLSAALSSTSSSDGWVEEIDMMEGLLLRRVALL